jgi:hypothetical protein
MPDTAPAAILAAAVRLQSSCRCTWAAADCNAVIGWLAPRQTEQPPGFPVVLSARGTTWWLEKA